MNAPKLIWNAVRWGIALLFLQTLFFKFSGHPESVGLFSKIGVEPWGRIALGIVELILGLLLVLNRFILGVSLCSTMVFCGAISVHIFFIGIEVNQDNGLLFSYAIVGFVLSFILFLKSRLEQ